MKKIYNKKGFTLVEIIVVIAIIGVLAAVLIPVMLGFVTSSRITSANKSANEIGEALAQTLTKYDTAGKGMLATHTATSIIRVEVSSSSGKTTWKTTVSDTDNFLSDADFDWTIPGTAMSTDDTNVENIDKPQNLISIELMKYFPDIRNGYGWFAVSGGYVKAAYFNDAGTSVAMLETDFDENGKLEATTTVDWEKKIAMWDGTNEGITPSGEIVGTSPALTISTISE